MRRAPGCAVSSGTRLSRFSPRSWRFSSRARGTTKSFPPNGYRHYPRCPRADSSARAGTVFESEAAMRIEDQRRSSNFEDRGTGRGGGGGGGLPIQALVSLVSLLGFKGTLLAGAALAIGFFVLPA